MMGRTLKELNCLKSPKMIHVAVKAPTFSFMRLKGADPVWVLKCLPRGEVACMDYEFAGAFIKALIASNFEIPKPDKPILIVVREDDEKNAIEIAKR
jgi:carbamoyl-phosphate synthase/aspartate carbamoyltransferase